jgi:hypothetical protein
MPHNFNELLSASVAISKKYRAEDAQNYINSVYECFKIAQERIDKGDL